MEKIFDNKRTYKTYDGEEILDLSIPCVNIKNLSVGGMMRLTQTEAGRIDRLVWDNVGHDMTLIDDVMYINHIFNPFSIEEGDVIRVPANSFSEPGHSLEPTLPDGKTLSNIKKGKKSKSRIQTIKDMIK